MSTLAQFQDAFSKALLADDVAAIAAELPTGVAGIVRLPAFAVYRNTVTRGLVDALVANHPAVARIVGDEWLRAAAAVFARAHPPRDPSLVAYSTGFDTFLAAFPPAAELPYLPSVARVDRLWTEAHGARDDPVVDPASFAALAPGQLGTARLVPHAAARWTWSAAFPIHALWSRNRAGDKDLSDLAWTGEGVLLTRPADAVRAVPAGPAHCAFLDVCAAGAPLADAASAALDADGNVELARLMANLLDAGAFARLEMRQPA